MAGADRVGPERETDRIAVPSRRRRNDTKDAARRVL